MKDMYWKIVVDTQFYTFILIKQETNKMNNENEGKGYQKNEASCTCAGW